MTKPANKSKPQPAGTAKVISLVRPLATTTQNDNAGSAPAIDPRCNYFANSNGPRWGRELRSN